MRLLPRESKRAWALTEPIEGDTSHGEFAPREGPIDLGRPRERIRKGVSI